MVKECTKLICCLQTIGLIAKKK